MAEYGEDEPKTEDISIKEAKDGLQAAIEERDNWLTCAKHSWSEIKKQKKNGTLWSVMPNSARKRVRYPLWNSTFQIRKPLVYSRTPVPVGRDTGGSRDSIGRSAAILLERLAKSIITTFPFNEVMEAARDDALITNLGQARAYYEMEEIYEQEKIYLAQTPDPQTGQVTVTYQDGTPLEEGKTVLEDDVGPYIETSRLVGVENEKVCLKPVLYRDFYVDACAYRWGDVYELWFGCDYSTAQFKAIFGKDALVNVRAQEEKAGQKDRRSIRVYEYWNLEKKKIGWFTQAGDDFIAKKLMTAEGEVDSPTVEDPYELEHFFPCPKPMVFNSPTDSFWPVCEWYQLNDLLEEIHTIASRIFTLSRAIRIRLLFDNAIPGLQSIINEVGESDAIGIANLTSTLNDKGGIASCVAYLPVGDMVEGLKNMYEALEQRLSKFEQLTGTGDLLQGETEANTGKTLGERQMEGKFATSRLMPFQEDMQRFARDSIELLCEMALKNFSDESLQQYIAPETLDDDEQQNYQAAIALLKNDRKRRFRIELETDSTIAINEDYQRQMTTQMVTALSQSLESTAQVLQSSPMLAKPLLLLQQRLASSFRDGKQFIDEMNGALDEIMKQQEAAAKNPQPPPPDPNMISAQASQMDAQTRAFIAQTDARREDFAVQSKNAIDQMSQQIEWFKAQSGASADAADAQAKAQSIMNDLQIALENIQTERAKLQLLAEQGAQSAGIEQFKVQLQAQDQAATQALEQAAAQIAQWKVQIDEREKLATEARLQREQMMEAQRMAMEQITQQPAPQVIPVGPSINIHQAPAPMGTVKRTMKDALGNTVTESTQAPIPQAPTPTIL